MAAKKQAAKARTAAEGASPYVQRVIEDAELRENVRVALENAKKAYARLTNGKPATKKRKRRGFGKLLLVGIIGAGVAVAASEGLRNKVLDTLFGAEEEFDYTSTTTPAPAGETVSSGS
jgi:hypothetical protein